MQFSEDAIKRLITAIGYAPQDGKSGIYLKSYQNHDGYCIFVDFTNISRAIDRFFTSYHDVTVSGIENAFSVYVSNVYDRLAFEDYISLFNGTPSEVVKAHELYEDYVKAFGEDFRSKAIEVEKEKLLYFLLTYSQTIVLVKTGKGKEEKKFLELNYGQLRYE